VRLRLPAQERRRELLLFTSELGLAALAEERGNRPSGHGFEDAVDVLDRPAEARPDLVGEPGLPGAHEADECEVLL
jgi:hypothetical protein